MLAASPVVICLLHGSAFAVDFAILRSHFWNRQTVPKWNRESAFLLFFNRSHFWNRVPVHFFIFFVSRLQKRNVLVQSSFVAYGDRKGN